MAGAFDVSEWEDMMSDTVLIYPWIRNSVSGVPTYSTIPVSFPAYIEMENHRIVDKQGREIMARGMVFIGGTSEDRQSYFNYVNSIILPFGQPGYFWPLNDGDDNFHQFHDILGGLTGSDEASGIIIQQPGVLADGSLGIEVTNTSLNIRGGVIVNSVKFQQNISTDVNWAVWTELAVGVDTDLNFKTLMSWEKPIGLPGAHTPCLELTATWVPAAISTTGVGFWYISAIVNCLDLGGLPLSFTLKTVDDLLTTPTFNVPIGQPLLVYFSLDNADGEANLYINGQLATSSEIVGTFTDASGPRVWFGATPDINDTKYLNGWNGILQDVAIWTLPAATLEQALLMYEVGVSSATVGVMDKVVLPSDYVPVSPPILSVDLANDENGTHHIVLHIG